MKRERDFDQTLKHWLDEGADHAPERFVWAALDDVERTAHRGAWRVSLEELAMTMKPAALALGAAAVIIVSVVAYQLLADPDVASPGPSQVPGHSPSSAPTVRVFTVADLPDVVITPGADTELGLTVDDTLSGPEALVLPLREGGPVIDQSAFVDALYTNLNTSDVGGYDSWAALFETDRDAEAARRYLVTEHESADGWGLEPVSPTPTWLGDGTVRYAGPAYGWDTAEIYLWRVGNLVLAAVGVGDFEPDQVRRIADAMNSRAFQRAFR